MHCKIDVISIVGEVDSGKTTLTKYLTNTKIEEYKDITQFISSYSINENTILIDNPGHEECRALQQYIIDKSDLIVYIIDTNKKFNIEKHKNLIGNIDKGGKSFFVVFTKISIKHSEYNKDNILNAVLNEMKKANFEGDFEIDTVDNINLKDFQKELFLKKYDKNNEKSITYLDVVKNKFGNFIKTINFTKDDILYELNGRIDKSNSYIKYTKMAPMLRVEEILNMYNIDLSTKHQTNPFDQYYPLNLFICSDKISIAISLYQSIQNKFKEITNIQPKFVGYRTFFKIDDLSMYKSCIFVVFKSKESNIKPIDGKLYVVETVYEINEITDTILNNIAEKYGGKGTVIKIFNTEKGTVYGVRMNKGIVKTGFNIISKYKKFSFKEIQMKGKAVNQASSKDEFAVMLDHNAKLNEGDSIFFIPVLKQE